MLARTRLLSRPTLFVLALSACMLAPLAMAAGPATNNSDLNARYQADIALCDSGQSNQDKATCIKEAGAALEEARRHRLTENERLSPENKTKRCEALPVEERNDCMVQMSGTDTTTEGSVDSGGVLRETTIPVPAAPVAQ